MKSAIKNLLDRAGWGTLAKSRRSLRPVAEFAGSIAELNFRGHRMLVTPDDDRVVFIDKDAQGLKIDFLRSVLQSHGPGVFIDVGANYGEFSLGVYAAASKVRAIEPNPIVFFCLSRTLAILPRAVSENIAISEEECAVPLAINPYASGGSSARSDRWGAMSRARTVNGSKNRLVYIDAKSRALSAILEEEDSSALIVIKMDVEGLELSILCQAAQALKRLARVLVFFESNAEDRDARYLETLKTAVSESGLRLYGFRLDGACTVVGAIDGDLMTDKNLTELILTNIEM